MSKKTATQLSTDGVSANRGPSRRSQRARIEIETYMVGVPDKQAGRYRRALEAGPSLRNAVNAKCAECVGFEDTTDRVRNCTTKRCALWSYRPYQTKEARPC